MSAGIREDRARALLGTSLKEKYRLERLLGVGGTAAVFEVLHRNQGRFALKLLHREISDDPDARKRFLQEGYAANVVDHRGVVRAIDDDVTEDGAAFLVLELLHGQSLDAWALGHPPEQRVMEVLYQALDVLGAAHDKGVIHRDIKPENLFLTDDGIVKVLDFGLARVRTAADPRLTQSGEVFGTPVFMPPEQARGETKAVGARSDLWSLAASIFNVLSGKFVHQGNSVSECVLLAATKPARSIAAVAPTLPGPFVAVLDRALAFDAKDRWPTATAMRAALASAYLSTYGARVPSVTRLSGHRAAAPRPRWPLAVGLGASVLLVAVGAAAWALRAKQATVDAAPAASVSAPAAASSASAIAAASEQAASADATVDVAGSAVAPEDAPAASAAREPRRGPVTAPRSSRPPKRNPFDRQ